MSWVTTMSLDMGVMSGVRDRSRVMGDIADPTYLWLRVGADEDPNGVLTGIRMLLSEGVVTSCAECGKPFTVYSLDNVYCSASCRKRASYERIKARRQFS